MHHRPPSPIRRGLVASTWEGSFAQVFITLTTGFFLVGYPIQLGASDRWLGMLAAVPFLAQAIQIATGWVYERAGEERRGITATTLLAARLVWLVPATLALLQPAAAGALRVHLVVTAASALLHTAGAHGWMSWMTDLVPRAVRGRYFGFRAAVCAVVALAIAWGAGLLLRSLESVRDGLGWAFAYGLAAVAGVGAWVAMRAQHHPAPPGHGVGVPFRTLWREVWAHADHRRLFWFFTLWNVAIGVAAPFWVKYLSVRLQLRPEVIAVQAALGGVIGVAVSRAWGRAIDRVGLRPVIVLNGIATALIPFFWLTIRPETEWLVWIDALLVGLFWSGFNLAALTMPLATAPARGGALFLGTFAALTGLAMGLSSIAGGFVVGALDDGPQVLLGLALTREQVVFVISGGLRLAALPWAFRLPDTRSRGLWALVTAIGGGARRALGLRPAP